jgi:APA family basic amino acid/polyamine antiporter
MREKPQTDAIAGHQSLQRLVGVFGATMMGLGSIIGTGVFVSIGIAAEAAGPSVVLAIALAAIVATCNGLSSAELAANHPVSGGTYEYGYRWLRPSLGFAAGWMFLCAKCASAATAALGFAGYALNLLQPSSSQLLVPLALATVAVLTLLVLSGMRRSNVVNIAIVSATLLALTLFVLAGLPSTLHRGLADLAPFFSPADASSSPLAGFLEATALMFVAYTGYGRIATLGEEIRNPKWNIPLAIGITLIVSMTLYVAVGTITVLTLGPQVAALDASQQAAPLELVARQFELPGVAVVVAIGAMTAMLGVSLNLILGLSRVALAMGRRGDLPAFFARINRHGDTPYVAVVSVGAVIAGLAAVGNVKTTWSFSAFAVLIYYAITNLAAIRLKEEQRLYHPVLPWIGLFSCLFLAFWVERIIWIVGCGLIVVGLALRVALRRHAHLIA